MNRISKEQWRKCQCLVLLDGDGLDHGGVYWCTFAAQYDIATLAVPSQETEVFEVGSGESRHACLLMYHFARHEYLEVLGAAIGGKQEVIYLVTQLCLGVLAHVRSAILRHKLTRGNAE
jgi:hypothetical protein